MRTQAGQQGLALTAAPARCQDTSDLRHFGTTVMVPKCPDSSALVPKCLTDTSAPVPKCPDTTAPSRRGPIVCSPKERYTHTIKLVDQLQHLAAYYLVSLPSAGANQRRRGGLALSTERQGKSRPDQLIQVDSVAVRRRCICTA